MDWLGRGLFHALICLLLGITTVGFGSYASVIVTGDDAFSIQHMDTGSCFLVQEGSLVLGNCSAEKARSWKWGSEHRLFHTGSSACLGLDVVSKALSLTSCSDGSILEWHCYEGFIYTAYQMKLSVTSNGTVMVKRNTTDSWSRGGTSENICEQQYQTMHTSGGNANGAPCKFPFVYNNTWHHSCLPSDDEHPYPWCSTTDNYDENQMWGNCLKYEEGCGQLWDTSVDGHCYQVVSTALVTWHEARDACRSQGGDLLSVSSPQDLQKFNGRVDLQDQLWIGLNQLDMVVGWQWSDGSPAAYIPWESDQSMWRPTECGVMTLNLQFRGEVCEKKLPYICEKKENSTQSEDTAKVVYKTTLCESGWMPGLGYCYKLSGTKIDERKSYTDAQKSCVEIGAHLVSIHNLEDVEMIHTWFTGKMLTAWIGLKAEKNTDLFKWEDGTNMSFTYWARNQPPRLLANSTSCVSLTDLVWNVDSCDKKKAFLCKKKGDVDESATEDSCPKDGDWRRHGNSCYKVDTQEISYKSSCKLTINSRFEQTFINRLLKEHVSSKAKYFWTGLQDTKSTREYQWFSQSGQASRTAFTNWKWGEPAKVGGCAVMTTNPLGQWIVKNCTEFKAGSICKTPVTAEPTATPAPDDPELNATCPPGWVSREGVKYCYKVFHEERLGRKRTWEEAQSFCEALGANLPSFTEEEEMSVLHDILRDSISDDRYFWVGLNRRNPNNENRWEWSDGRPVSMMIFPQEFHEDDDYNRDCTAFKSLKQKYMLVMFFLLYSTSSQQFYPRAFHCDAQLEWVCQIPRGHTPKNPEWYNPDGHHDTSVFIDNQEFWFVTQPKLSYEQASIYCSSNQSRLATPKSINAARHLHEHLYKHAGTDNWWVDFQDTITSLPFRPRLQYYKRFLGRCTSLTPGSFMPDFKILCSSKQPFVCETLNVTAAENKIPEHPPGKPCEDNTIAFRDKCYTVLEPRNMTFKLANEFCQSLRGSLLSIRDQVEQDFITTLLLGQPQKIWIGLKLKLQEMQWVDNTPVKYLNFNPLLHGQLRIHMYVQDELELCSYMFNDPHSDILGTWDYTSCVDELSLTICQHYADKDKTPNVSEGEFQVNNHTFKIILKDNLTWYEALELCKKSGMDLVSVTDAYQQAVLTVNVSNVGYPLWIGLFSRNDEQYHWTDHSHTVFSRWGSEVTVGKCVYLDTDGFWKATECEQQLNGAICHIPHEDHITKKENTTRCPHYNNGHNWIPFKNNCYTFLLGRARWQKHEKSDDQNTCKRLVGTGDVLTIRNEEENQFIMTQLQPFRDLAAFVWLGMYQSKEGNQMKWFDDTNVQYSNWSLGRPNVTEPFMAGLSLSGDWIVIRDKTIFEHFAQRAIVVCKIENDPKDEYRLNPTDVTAPHGYSFQLFSKKLNWSQALEECSSINGHLVSIHNETANRDMALIAKRDGFPLWIGLSRQDVTWPYEWSDGTALQFHPQTFEDFVPNSKEKCVFVDSKGNWNAYSCSAELEGAICYKSVQTSQIPVRSSTNCPESHGQTSWLQFKDHCYAINMTQYNYSIYTMTDAKSVCKTLEPSSELLTIKNQEENDFVSRHVSESPLITSRVWLALPSLAKDKVAVWMDGSALDFSNWAHNQPLSGCAVLVSTNGTWTTVDCKDSRSRVVCKAPAKSAGTPVALVFFFVVLFCVLTLVAFVVYKKTRHRYFSTVRYQRNFDEADSTSMIAEAE